MVGSSHSCFSGLKYLSFLIVQVTSQPCELKRHIFREINSIGECLMKSHCCMSSNIL